MLIVEKVKKVRDDEFNWYTIPNDMIYDFYNLLSTPHSRAFEQMFAKFRTKDGGGVNDDIQLYADLSHIRR